MSMLVIILPDCRCHNPPPNDAGRLDGLSGRQAMQFGYNIAALPELQKQMVAVG